MKLRSLPESMRKWAGSRWMRPRRMRRSEPVAWRWREMGGDMGGGSGGSGGGARVGGGGIAVIVAGGGVSCSHRVHGNEGADAKGGSKRAAMRAARWAVRSAACCDSAEQGGGEVGDDGDEGGDEGDDVRCAMCDVCCALCDVGDDDDAERGGDDVVEGRPWRGSLMAFGWGRDGGGVGMGRRDDDGGGRWGMGMMAE